MKKGLLILTFILTGLFFASAQTPDTVCAGATSVPYWVNGNAGSTFTWTVNGGTKVYGGTTDSIGIDFASTAGIDTIIVQETDSNGCPGDPVLLAIVRIAPPNATIAGGTSLCYEDSTNVTITLTGDAPWDLIYNDGSGNTNITLGASPYVIATSSLTSTKTYTLVSVDDRHNCSTTLSGGSATATVVVFPQVVTPAIQHN